MKPQTCVMLLNLGLQWLFISAYLCQRHNGLSVSLKLSSFTYCIDLFLASASGILGWKPDRSKALASQIACKEHFSGESEGFRLQATGNLSRTLSFFILNRFLDSAGIEKIPPMITPPSIRNSLKVAMVQAIRDVQNKTSPLTIPELKRLLFRCASVLVASPHVSHVCHSIITINSRIARQRIITLSGSSPLRNFYPSYHLGGH